MLNYSVDIGNSRVKIGLFKGKSLLKVYSFTLMEFKSTTSFWDLFPEKAMVSSVLTMPETKELLMIFEQTDMELHLLDSETMLPFINRYESVQTLGKDRIAVAVGAHARFPEDDILVVDCGTCITFDFVNKQGEYLGGAISPGVRMRLQAMHKFTSKLPFKEWEHNLEVKLIGRNTDNALLSGAVNGAVAEVDGIIEQYNATFPYVKTIITGGDSSFFEKKLKNTIFADPNLVLKGLNEILLYNSENI